MPYKTIKDLPAQIKQLPISAKKIFLKAFNKASQSLSEEKSFKIAWGAVKRIYTKKNNVWVKKTSIKFKKMIGRSGFFGKNYYFDAVISSDSLAEDGLIASPLMLQNLYESDRIDKYGDVDHLNLKGQNSFNNLFILTDKKYENGKLYGRFVVDKSHNDYDWFVSNYHKENVELSAEFMNYKTDGKYITDCERLGWTVLLNESPADKSAVGI